LGSKEGYRILEDRVFIKAHNIYNSLEHSVKFEEIGFDLVRKKTNSIIWLIPFNLSLVVLVVWSS
jgi:hypothetical protein